MSEPPTPPQSPRPAETPGAERERRLTEALAEYVDLCAQEENVDADAFCRQHPDIREDLRAAIKAFEEIGNLTAPGEAPQPQTSTEHPQRLSGHRILGELGAGGMGRVFLAEDERLGRKVAIKTLSPRYRENPALRARFMQEARALAQLTHPHIVHIYNLGSEDEEPHFVMELVEGVPLTESARALPLAQRADLVRKAALAVEFLHQHRMLHRDIKPANILVGHDLEPKLLDFGLARHTTETGQKLTHAGDLLGTPDYFSPEQTQPGATLDARSDVFSLGTILYEVLTGAVPFRGKSLAEQLLAIREEDPVPPRRLNPGVPRDLQNICLKALEKDPAHRYSSARELAEDLDRYLASEPVLGAPTTYASLMAAKVGQHLRELEGWKQDQILSESEFDALHKQYSRLSEPEDAWIMQVRRLSLPQVTLYLGAWVIVVAAALIFLFEYRNLPAWASVALVAAAAAPTGYGGIRLWREGQLRTSVAFLLAFCFLLPAFFLVTFHQYKLFAGFTKGNQELEIFAKLLEESARAPTNAQIWWALLLTLPAVFWLRRFTGSSVFSLVFSVLAALFSQATMLRMGALEWPAGLYYWRLLPVALVFFLAAYALERRGLAGDSRYFYPVAVLCTYGALSGSAYVNYDHNRLARLIEPLIRRAQAEHVYFFFIFNAGIYYLLQKLGQRMRTEQTRAAAKAFRFVIPSHVLVSLFLLGLSASELWHDNPAHSSLRFEARLYEVLLPLVACLFVFGSIQKQMKNYLATGLLFLAIGIYRLQDDLLAGHVIWPVSLLLLGGLLMALAVRYSALKMALIRRLRRRP